MEILSVLLSAEMHHKKLERKKAMHSLFNLESPLMSCLGKLFDCIVLSLCWILASLPIITFGASCGALYRASYRCIRRDEGHLLKVFWDTFRRNLKICILTWLSVCAVYILLFADMFILERLMSQGYSMVYLFIILGVLIGVTTAWAAYCTAYCVSFEGNLKQILGQSLVLTLSHPIMTILILALLVIGVVLILFVPVLVLLLPALICVVISFPMEKVFLKHMRPEDVEKVQNGQ